MPLIDLKTDLKSLKYGKDRPGGGDSGQPYQKVDINKVDSGFNRFRMTKFDDGLVRGGVVGAVNASIVDTLRIGKFLKDFPKGPLFITKQVGLQLTNPIIEHKTNFPTNKPTREQGLFNNIGNFISNIANRILNAVGPTRIYNLGINTLAQIPVNAFGQHIQRHGFTPRRNDDNLYFKVVQYNNNEGNNRLTNLRSILGNTKNINTYLGGPSSIYGIGTTIIQRRGKFININQDTTASPWATSKEINDSSYVQSSAKNLISTSNLKIGADLGLSKKTFSKLVGDLKIPINPSGSAAYDRIASKNDPLDNKYKAIEQEASASAKMRTPNDFVGASKFVNSSLSTTTFLNLTSADNKPLTLDNRLFQIGDNKNPSKSTNQLNYFNTLGVSKQYFSTTRSLEVNTKISTANATSKPTYIDQSSVNGKAFGDPKYTYADVRTQLNDQQVSGSKYLDKSKDVSNQINNLPVLYGVSKEYGGIDTSTLPSSKKFANYAALKSQVDKNNNISQEYYGGEFKTVQVNVNRGADDFQYVTRELENKFVRTNDRDTSDDSLSIVFRPIDPFTGATLSTLRFLGYITEYNETYDSSWNDVKYIGRAEKFYLFNEFKRSVSVGFNIPCFNEYELENRHCAISELASTLAGKYENNLLGGIITRLKLGSYIDNQPGIITNLSFQPIQDSSWDLDMELAFYLKVTFNFTLIHDYLPQYTECGFIFNPPKLPPPRKEPKPEPPPPAPAPAPAPAPIPGPRPTLFTDDKKIQDNTYIKKPLKTSPIRKFQGFGGGSSGGAGAGGSW
jgi:hypothetical protein